MKKVKVKKCSDDELRLKCEEQTGLSCDQLEWASTDTQLITPASDVTALIVDMYKSEGHVRFYDSEDEFLDMVGWDYKKRLVIVPWTEGYKYVCYGNCTVAEVASLKATQATR